MRTLAVFILSFFWFHSDLQAQSNQLKIQTLSSSGSSSLLETSSGTLLVQQSIGQSSTIGLGNTSSTLARQGFIQPPVSAAKLSESSTLSANVYPNPFSDGFKIEFDEIPQEEVAVVVMDISGRQVFSGHFRPGSSRTIELNTLDYAAGSYILQVISSHKSFSSTLIKS